MVNLHSKRNAFAAAAGRTPLAVERSGGIHGFRARLSNHSSLALLIPLLLLFLQGGIAVAQTWQYVYGPLNTIQEGRRGVRPILGTCTGGVRGYIATGFSDNATTNNDVYVVRTDPTGAAVWEKMYDININSEDVGESIIELSDGTGFLVVGHTTSGSNTDVFLMKIACDGSVGWTRIYGTSGTDEYGYDLIETVTGTAGEFIIAGKVDLTGNDANALLIRTTSAGVALWQKMYDGSGLNDDEGFRSLVEVVPVGSQPAGDIVAVGHTGDYGGIPDGYVARVAGNSGTITTGGGSLQGTARYGGPDDDGFESVIQLQNPAELGSTGLPNVVVAGHSYRTSMPNDRDMYVIKLDGGNPCEPIIQHVVGMLGPGMEDDARCIREVTFAPSSSAAFTQWSLAVTGYHKNPTTSRDMALVMLNGALIPTAGRLFGHIEFGIEEGWSVYPVNSALAGGSEGFILCGLTTTPWHIYANGNNADPGDLYLVKTDNQFSSVAACWQSFGPSHEEFPWDEECLGATVSNNSGDSPLITPAIVYDTDAEICTGFSNDGDPNTNKEVIGSTQTEARITVQPNILKQGDPLQFVVSGIDHEQQLSVSIVNTLGEEMKAEIEQFTPSTGEMRMKTTGWPAGIYYIIVENGKQRWGAQVRMQ